MHTALFLIGYGAISCAVAFFVGKFIETGTPEIPTEDCTKARRFTEEYHIGS